MALSPHCIYFGISTHALREEGDGLSAGLTPGGWNFYPRPPRGGRPQTPKQQLQQRISTHALREEGDPNAGAPHLFKGDFYPRPPRGGRPCLL